MLRVVIDTNIWIRILLKGRVTLPILAAFNEDKFQLKFDLNADGGNSWICGISVFSLLYPLKSDRPDIKILSLRKKTGEDVSLSPPPLLPYAQLIQRLHNGS